MRKLTKLISLVLTLALVMGLAACGGAAPAPGSAPASAASGTPAAPAAPTSEKTTIHLWHIWTTETDSMRIATDKAVKDYMAEHPEISIEIHMLENEAYKTKISTEFAGSAKGIDMFFYWGAGRAAKLANADKLLAVDDYITPEVKSLMKPGSTQAFEYGGKLYALPIYSWVKVLYCNTELFEKAGAKVPTTYAELLDASKKLSAAGITPIAQGIKEAWQAAFVFEALALREVGAKNENMALSGQMAFDDPGYLSAAQKTKELFEAGAFGKNPLEIGSPDADAMFYSGKAAMRLQGNWFTDGIYTDKNSVVGDPGKVVAMPIPMTDSANANATDYSGGFVDSFFINKNTANPQAVMDFNVYLCKELAKVRHESGQGFTGWTLPVDESGLKPVAKEVSALANTLVDGVLAWDTLLDENTATTHLEEIQTLFAAGGDPAAVIEAHKEVIGKK